MSFLRRIKQFYWVETFISLLLCLICLSVTLWVWMSLKSQPVWMFHFGQNQYIVEVNWIHTPTILGVGIAASLMLSFTFFWLLRARKRTLDKLMQTHHKLKKAIEQLRPLERIANNTMHNVIITDADGVIEWVNVGFVQSMGFAAPVVIGKPYTSLRVGPKTLEQTLASIRRHMLDGEHFQGELELYDRSQQPHWLAVDIQPIHNNESEVEQYVCIESNITSKRTMVTALESRERKLNLVMHAANIGMWEIVPDTERLVVNDAWMRLMGYTPGEHAFTRTQVESWIHPEDHAGVVSAMQDFWEGKALAYEVEFRMMNANGVYRWFFTMGDVLMHANGKDHKHMVGVLVDIDATKRASLELQASEQKLRMISDATRDSVIMLDPQDRIVHWNPAAEKLFGQKQSQAIGQRFHENLIERPKQLAEDAEKSDKQSNYLFEINVRHQRGLTIPVEASYSFVGEKDKQWTIVILRDITERLQMLKALRESEALFHHVADNVPALIWMVDAEGWITFFNRRWEDFTGRPVQMDLGRGWEEIVHPDDKPALVKAFDRAVDHQVFFRHEYRMRHHSGEYRWVLDEGHPRYSDSGTYLGMIGSSTDITRERAIREQLTKARDAAESATRAKSEFLANMSHEIRTPMTSILGYTDLLKTADQDEAFRDNCIQTIERNGKHLMAVINDILDLSRIEMGGMTLEQVDCAIPRLMDEVIGILQSTANEKNIEIRCRYASDIPKTVQTDPMRIKQILINLLGNAIKFTYKGYVELNVQCIPSAPASLEEALLDPAVDANAMLSISVKDTGIGISKAQVKTLFEPFSQGDTSMSRRFGGTGLGLAISQKLAHLLDGEIQCTSKLNQGSTFTLSLPVHIPRNTPSTTESGSTSDAASKNPQDEDPSGSADITIDDKPLETFHLLLAEDSIDNSRLICYHLERAGATVEVVPNGREACNAIVACKQPPLIYDVILMDMQMPEMDGYEATQTLRNAGVRLPIIALTAHAMEGDRERCLDAGCDEYLSKPVSPDALIEVIARLKADPSHH